MCMHHATRGGRSNASGDLAFTWLGVSSVLNVSNTGLGSMLNKCRYHK